jgi:hypothetical protein
VIVAATIGVRSQRCKYGMSNMRQWMTVAANMLTEATDESAGRSLMPIDVAEDRATDIYTDLGTCERVVWDREDVIETGPLSLVGLGDDVPGIYGLHVTNDIEFWFTQLVNDYDRDTTAYVIEIQCLDTDVLVEDNQIMDRDAVSASSHVLLTTRPQLVLGKDFKYIRTLTEADLEEDPDDEDEEGDGDDSPSM